jgi:hypothetical protein
MSDSPIRVTSTADTAITVYLTALPTATVAGGVVQLAATLDEGSRQAVAGSEDEWSGTGTYRVTWELEGPTGDPEDPVVEATTTEQDVLVESLPHVFRRTVPTAELLPAQWTSRVSVNGPVPVTGAAVWATGAAEPPWKDETSFEVTPRPLSAGEDVAVSMRRAAVTPTDDQALWVSIRNSTTALGFPNFDRFIERVWCENEDWVDQPDDSRGVRRAAARRIEHRVSLPFPRVERYRVLKASAEIFLMINCRTDRGDFDAVDLNEESDRIGRQVGRDELESIFRRYLVGIPDGQGGELEVLPYLELIRRKLGDVPLIDGRNDEASICYGIIAEKLRNPCFLELINSYWYERSGVVRAVQAILRRFQNRPPRRPGRDPLAGLDVDPLRPLNNTLWGLVQDQQHLLTVDRREAEYQHLYGLTLGGPARPVADFRSRFLGAFHHLLAECMDFYDRDDNTVFIATGFDVLNCLKEVHLTLVQGAHNAYGDLPSTARQEMLVLQWILGSRQIREFLPSRIMVDQPEAWMDAVDAMNHLQGWDSTPALHYRDLAVYGEQLLLSIRFGAWTGESDPARAANWARYFRREVQQYCHAYRAVTGHDILRRREASSPNGFRPPMRQRAYRD